MRSQTCLVSPPALLPWVQGEGVQAHGHRLWPVSLSASSSLVAHPLLISRTVSKAVPPLTGGATPDRLRVGGEATCVVPPKPTHPVHLTAEEVKLFHQLSSSSERRAHRKRWRRVLGSFGEGATV